MVRAVSAAATPVISAIGHEQDWPLLDYVSDVRASTPTDAAKRVVPSFLEQCEIVEVARERLDAAIDARLLSSAESITQARHRLERSLSARIDHGEAIVHGLSAQVRALSPQSTLDRGYAIVQHGDRHTVRSPDEVSDGQELNITVAEGSFTVTAKERNG